MVTQIEQQQTKDFLKRAEIRTMKKDLSALREKDALKERDKIVKIKTLEEQLQELQVKQEKPDAEPLSFIPVPVKAVPAKTALNKKVAEEIEKAGVREILQRSQTQERLAEKDLKNYATEQERQQIFLLESERLGFENQADGIDKEKIPALKLEKNKASLQKRNLQEKLKSVLEQEGRLEGEQKVVAQKSQESTVPSQKKSLEERRWDIDKEIQKTEKERWVLENQIQDADKKATEIDKLTEQLVVEKNRLQEKILGMDKSLRDIYSQVIAKVEEKRRGESENQKIQRGEMAKIRIEEKEKIQREQWRGISVPKKNEFLKSVPEGFKEKLAKSAVEEEQKRSQFLQDVESWSEDKNNESGT